MRNTRFILVEGIMGAGKSTTAGFLTEQIRQHGIAARFLAEGPSIEEPEHPLRVATEFPHPNGIWLDLTVEEYSAPVLMLHLLRVFQRHPDHEYRRDLLVVHPAQNTGTGTGL
jgi:ABC-type multidrug transport system ATPase subunit